MKCLFASDLHGEIRLYQELLSLVSSTSSDIIAIGGDLLPSFPPTKRYEDMVPNQKAFIDQFLAPFFKRALETTSILQIFLIPGNWDLAFPYIFRSPLEGITDLSQKKFQLKNGYELVGYPFIPPTPFRPKNYEKMDDRESPWPSQKNPSYILVSRQEDQLTPIDPYLYLRERETIEEDLNNLPIPLDLKKTIYIMHSPPFGTRLDIIEGGVSAGSHSIRSFFEKNQPLLSLHGHIHESAALSGAYVDRIGETISVNPGQSAWSGGKVMKLDAVVFEIENVEGTLRHTREPLVPSPSCQ